MNTFSKASARIFQQKTFAPGRGRPLHCPFCHVWIAQPAKGKHRKRLEPPSNKQRRFSATHLQFAAEAIFTQLSAAAMCRLWTSGGLKSAQLFRRSCVWRHRRRKIALLVLCFLCFFDVLRGRNRFWISFSANIPLVILRSGFLFLRWIHVSYSHPPVPKDARPKMELDCNPKLARKRTRGREAHPGRRPNASYRRSDGKAASDGHWRGNGRPGSDTRPSCGRNRGPGISSATTN